MRSKFIALAAAALAVIGIATAPGTVAAEGEKFVLISHAPDSDSWWNTIKNAIGIAGEQMGVTVDYRNPSTGDLADMARIVEQASAANPDGIIVTIADFDVLSGPITDAVDKGIPVITINSGTHEQSEQLGALLHVGQPEYDAGFGAGKKAKAAGVTKFLCVNHYITNPASVERCRGYADALGVELGNQMIDSGQDPAEIKNKVMAHLNSNEDANGIITLGPTSAHPTLAALEALGLSGEIHFGTFDLSEEIAAGSQGRDHRLRDRPAALSPGLHAGRYPDEPRALRRGALGSHEFGARIHHHEQYRAGRAVRGRIPLILF